MFGSIHPARVVGAGLLCVAVTALTACSSSSKPTSAASSAAGSTGSGAAPSPQLALDVAHKGVTGPLMSTPVTPKTGVNYWVVSCGQAVTTCSSTAAGAADAAKKLGWTVHLCDGQLNPAGISSCIRQAVAAKAQALDVIGTDCGPIKQALVEANAAGVKTIGGGGFDCSETGGEKTYSGIIKYQADLTNHQWWAKIGKLQADWLIGSTAGAAKVLSLKFTDEAWGADIQDAFTAEIKTCSGCSIVKVQEMSNGDLAAGTLRTKFSTALLQSPSVNAVNVPIDGWFSAGLAQAVTSSGRAAKLKVIGSIGEIPNMGYIRSDAGENATTAFSGDNSGWAGTDVAVRLLAGQTAPALGFVEGIGIQAVDKTAGLPAAGQAYQPPADYKSNYLKLWGVQ